MTRTAFRATLEISNHDPTTSLQSVTAQVEIRDMSGQLANDRFQIESPILERINQIDGAGTIASQSTATIRWMLIPADDAAPTQMSEYNVGGQFSYTLGGIQAKVPLEWVKITVYPDAALALKYFHQRDVISDDPFTPQIEPAVPYALAVMVKNQGAGPAKSLKITSGQPQIVENEKGLLIDFKLVGARINGTNAPGTMALDFGRIEPGGTRIAEWFFTSSLQGFFKDFSATFQHEDTLGSPRISTIKSISIHEMAHIVEAGGVFADDQPDFLVNDVPDPQNLPETLYLSDGTTSPVQSVQQSSNDGAPSAGDHEVQLVTTTPSGWVYLRVPDPSDGQMQLTQVRRSDGAIIPQDVNAWVTTRTFPGPGQRPRNENLLHILDYDSPGVYTLSYGVAAPLDTMPPTSSIASLPPASTISIPVRWSGEDNEGGTGLSSFDVFVSEGSGQFQPWLQGTTLQGAIYTGLPGQTYAFYSVARDVAGNRQSTPGAPQAVTTVSLINRAPVLPVIPEQKSDEGGVFILNLAGSDLDLPNDRLTYSLAPGAPRSLVLNTETGELRWSTTEMDGPGTHSVTVSVNDNGQPSLSDTKTFQLVIKEVNTRPALGNLTTRTVDALTRMVVANPATDSDLPANSLTYQLLNPPDGAAIDHNGVITWTPTVSQAPSTNTITTVVTDSGDPPLSSTNSFLAVVNQPQVTLAGTIAYYGQYPPGGLTSKRVRGVTMGVTGGANHSRLSLDDGSFVVGNSAGGSYVLTPSKADDEPLANGVTTLDIVLIRRHVLGAPLLDSPYKVLAADIRGSRNVSTLGISLLRKFILGLTNDLPGGLWRFVPAEHEFADLQAPWDAPASRSYSNLSSNVTDQNFYAIKVGDVNNSWAPPVHPSAATVRRVLSATEAQGDVPTVGLEMNTLQAAPGQNVTINIKVRGFSRVTTAQFTLAWDPAVLQFIEAGDFGLDDLSAANLGQNLVASGKLTFSWDDTKMQGVTVADGTSILSLKFSVIGKPGAISPLTLTDAPTAREISIDFDLGRLDVSPGQVTVLDQQQPIWVSASQPGNGEVHVSVTTANSLRYTLEYRESLTHGNWQELMNFIGDGTVQVFADRAATNQQRFYRVRVR